MYSYHLAMTTPVSAIIKDLTVCDFVQDNTAFVEFLPVLGIRDLQSRTQHAIHQVVTCTATYLKVYLELTEMQYL